MHLHPKPAYTHQAGSFHWAKVSSIWEGLKIKPQIFSRRFVVPHFEIQPNPPYPSMFHQDLFALELLPTDLRYWWSFDSTSTCQARKISGLALWWSRFLPVSFNNWCEGWCIFHVWIPSGGVGWLLKFKSPFAKKTYHITYTQQNWHGTWELFPWKRKIIFQTIIFGYYVNLPGCTISQDIADLLSSFQGAGWPRIQPENRNKTMPISKVPTLEEWVSWRKDPAWFPRTLNWKCLFVVFMCCYFQVKKGRNTSIWEWEQNCCVIWWGASGRKHVVYVFVLTEQEMIRRDDVWNWDQFYGMVKGSSRLTL